MRIMIQELRSIHGFKPDDNSKICDLDVSNLDQVLHKYWDNGTYTWSPDTPASEVFEKHTVRRKLI